MECTLYDRRHIHYANSLGWYRLRYTDVFDGISCSQFFDFYINKYYSQTMSAIDTVLGQLSGAKPLNLSDVLAAYAWLEVVDSCWFSLTSSRETPRGQVDSTIRTLIRQTMEYAVPLLGTCGIDQFYTDSDNIVGGYSSAGRALECRGRRFDPA